MVLWAWNSFKRRAKRARNFANITLFKRICKTLPHNSHKSFTLNPLQNFLQTPTNSHKNFLQSFTHTSYKLSARAFTKYSGRTFRSPQNFSRHSYRTFYRTFTKSSAELSPELLLNPPEFHKTFHNSFTLNPLQFLKPSTKQSSGYVKCPGGYI